MNLNKIRLGILASGNGSNADSIMSAFKDHPKIEVVCVLSNKKEAMVLEKAKVKKVNSFYVRKLKADSAEAYDQKLINILQEFEVDWVVCAGYMKLLTHFFLKTMNYKVLNIHPSLLPEFPGKNAYEDAFSAKVKRSGCTVHLVDEGIDSGRIISQKPIELKSEDTLESFKERGLAIENKFYPEVIEIFLLEECNDI